MPMGEKKSYTCPNAACKKTFSAPLKTLDLQMNPSEPYYACPVCLTRIETQEQANWKKQRKPLRLNLLKRRISRVLRVISQLSANFIWLS
jgi:DNA-directed RNA polymerase subunit RPC12/RpoP